jgi:hypothetical protein
MTSEMAASSRRSATAGQDLEWFTLNAMKSAFLPFDQRLAIINERIKPGYAQPGRAPEADGVQRRFLDGVAAPGGLAPERAPLRARPPRAGRPWWSTDAAAATSCCRDAAGPPAPGAGTALRVLVALNWGVVLSRWLDRAHPVVHGAGAGLALWSFQYCLIGRRRPSSGRCRPHRSSSTRWCSARSPGPSSPAAAGSQADPAARPRRSPPGHRPGGDDGQRRRPRGRRAPASTTPGRAGRRHRA